MKITRSKNSGTSYDALLVVIFVTAILGNTCLGQTLQKENSVVKLSDIYLDPGINTQNLPAISMDGDSVMYIEENYFELTGEVPEKIVVMNKGILITTIYLYDHDVEVPKDRIDKFYWKSELEKKKLSDILTSTKYVRMTPIETYEVIKKNDSLIDMIRFSYKKETLFTVGLRLRQESKHPYCCGDPDSIETCRLQSRIIRLWLDPNEKYIFAEQGEPQFANGCEIEATYHLLKITKHTM